MPAEHEEIVYKSSSLVMTTHTIANSTYVCMHICMFVHQNGHIRTY
jgi:hypothetical protein